MRGQKVAEYNGGGFLPSAAAQTGEVDPANRRRVVDYVRSYLPGLDPEPYAETTCLFTNTPNEDFIIDRARQPDHPLAVFRPRREVRAADRPVGGGPGHRRRQRARAFPPGNRAVSGR